MIAKNTFYLEHIINNYDIDFNKTLKFSQLQNLFQNAAGYHSEELGLGFISLAQRGMGWVLSRMKMQVTSMPTYGEKVIVESWPIKPGFVEYERDFLMKNQSGDIIVRAASRWCIYDLHNAKMVKSSDVSYIDGEQLREDRALSEASARIRDNGIQWESAYSGVVRASDLDLNRHMNNTRYLEWVTDCFSLDSLLRAKPDSMQIDYLNQVKYGETMDMYVSHSPKLSYSKGVVNGKTAFICSISKIL